MSHLALKMPDWHTFENQRQKFLIFDILVELKKKLVAKFRGLAFFTGSIFLNNFFCTVMGMACIFLCVILMEIWVDEKNSFFHTWAHCADIKKVRISGRIPDIKKAGYPVQP